jgi:hypothetical protein
MAELVTIVQFIKREKKKMKWLDRAKKFYKNVLRFMKKVAIYIFLSTTGEYCALVILLSYILFGESRITVKKLQ